MIQSVGEPPQARSRPPTDVCLLAHEAAEELSRGVVHDDTGHACAMGHVSPRRAAKRDGAAGQYDHDDLAWLIVGEHPTVGGQYARHLCRA